MDRSFANGNSFNGGSGPGAASGTSVISVAELRGEHWWLRV